MVGQNVLLELVEGDKVQLYVYTAAGITDHKNSHYTQFIGTLLRPSVDTLATIMRKLGTSDTAEDDVSVADDTSMRSRGMNGDASQRRRGGSKNRVLSPGPQSPSASTKNVIQEEEEPPLQLQVPVRNENGGANGTAGEEISNGATNGTVHTNGSTNGTSNGDAATTAEKEAAAAGGGKSSQSYLALTKLGMGGQKEGKVSPAPKEAHAKKSESPTKNVSKESGKRKTMAEMASSTLKGFTKM